MRDELSMMGNELACLIYKRDDGTMGRRDAGMLGDQDTGMRGRQDAGMTKGQTDKRTKKFSGRRGTAAEEHRMMM